MNIKTKLSLRFSLIVAGVLLFFSVLVYYFSYSSQVSKFHDNLLENAKNTAILLINVVEVDSTLLKKIHQSTIQLDQEEIVLTDSAFHVRYSNKITTLTDEVIRANYSNYDVSFFSRSGKDGVYYKHRFKGQVYHVYVMAYDTARRENLADLRGILFWSIVFSILLSVLFSYLFSKNAIKPIADIIKSIRKINSARLGSRLKEGKNNDELDQLARSFNEMLAKLDQAFKNQEEFISNASHELKTPLSVMIAESDYVLSHESSPEEYRRHISEMVADLKIMNAQINSLLELAQLNSDQTIRFTAIRIDEIVYHSIHQIRAKYPGRKMLPVIQYPENESDLLVEGNESLLEIVFNNLLENACKFSGGDIHIEFRLTGDHILINITDQGIGIPKGDIENVYHPFIRASNARNSAGFGIGLSLVSKILELHRVNFKISSFENEGTRFEMTFRKAGNETKEI